MFVFGLSTASCNRDLSRAGLPGKTGSRLSPVSGSQVSGQDHTLELMGYLWDFT